MILQIALTSVWEGNMDNQILRVLRRNDPRTGRLLEHVALNGTKKPIQPREILRLGLTGQ